MLRRNGFGFLSLLVLVLGCGGGKAGPPSPTPAAPDPVVPANPDPIFPVDPGTDPGVPSDPAVPGNPLLRSFCPDGVLADLVERRDVYAQDGPQVAPVVVEITVADLAGLAAVNANAPDAKVDASFRQGTFGQGATATQPNAVLELRGHSTRQARQKSYKIKLNDKNQLWRGQREIHLNKHPFDLARVRNRLAFDLLRSVPHLTSLRTGFVRLRLNGEELGLYTWIEDMDRRYLDTHGLDVRGQLYKARRYNFQVIDDATAVDPVRLAEIIDARANPDLNKLQRMARALADPAVPPKTLLDTFFNRRNYMTWVAFNVLTGNFDTNSQNYYLYSPADCEGWYFLPWDYDGAFGFREQRGQLPRERFHSAFAYWWNSPLHRRFLADPDLLQELETTIAHLATALVTDAAVAPFLDRYRDVVRAAILTPPDLWNLPSIGGMDADADPAWSAEYNRLGSVIGKLYTESLETRHRPTSIHLGDPQIAADGAAAIRFRWGVSTDLQGDPITYDLEIGPDPVFDPATLVVAQRGLTTTSVFIPLLPAGHYVWRVVIRDNKGNWQLPYDAFEPLDIR